MSNFVQTEDFETGELKLPVSNLTEETLQEYIDRIEIESLTDLLGCDLYALFIADWLAVTALSFSEDRFKAIYNPICIDQECGQLRSEGIKQMLMHFIYFKYVRDIQTDVRVSGIKQTYSENSKPATGNQAGLFLKKNKGVEIYKAIQEYIYLNPDSYDYEDYNGINKDFAGWL